MLRLSRRDLARLTIGGLGAAGLGLPRRARAAASASERRFLFFFLRGGWDYSYLTPLYDNDNVDCPDDGEPAEAGGVAYVASAMRPAMTEFFEAWGDRTAILNGVEVPSVAHDRCIRFTLTGGVAIDADDFPTIIASHALESLLMPHTIVNGPAFAADLGGYVVRVGEDGQLGKLVDGSALETSEMRVSALDDNVEQAVDAFVRQRASSRAAEAGAPALAARYASMLERLAGVGTELDGVELNVENNSQAAALCVAVLERGLSRCAMMQHLGLFDAGWDTHASNVTQDSHFQLAFETLNEIMAGLAAGTSPVTGGSLLDDTTVVVLSEMGRSPKINGSGGKDHWTFGSAMLIGGGVRGGQTVGAFADDVSGATIDFATGERSDSGKVPHVKDLGATLLAMADVDPGDWINNGAPITAVMAD